MADDPKHLKDIATAPRLPAGLTPRLLSRVQAAAYCGISPSHFDATIARDVPAIDVGRRHLWDIRALDRWVDAHGAPGRRPPTIAELLNGPDPD
jgi:hypothetical protein